MPREPGLGAPSLLGGVGSDVAWTYVGVLSVGVASLLVPAISLRRLGPTGYGLYALVAAASSFIIPLDVGLSFGVSRAAAREATTEPGPARDVERARVVASHSLYAVAAGAVLVLTAMAWLTVRVGLVGGTSSRGSVSALVGFLGLNTAVVLGTSAYNGLLLGTRRFRTAGGGAVLGSALTCAALPWSTHAMSVAGIGFAVLLGSVGARSFVVHQARRVTPWMVFQRPAWHNARLREVAAVALPMIVVGIGSQIVATTDVFIISIMGSSASVGLYRAASLIPSQIIYLVFRGYDACFPALAQERDEARQEAATRTLTRIASVAGGVALGGVAWLSPELIKLLTGRSSDLGVDVLRIFAAVWCVNAAAHGLALVLIVRLQHKIFTPLVLGESVVNVVASVVLVRIMGPVGAAWGTLATIAVSNLLLLPLLTRKHLVESSFALVLGNGLLFACLGVAVARLVVWLVSTLGFAGTARLGLAAVGLVLAGAALAAVSIGREGRMLMYGAMGSKGAREAQPVPPEVYAS